MSEQKQETVLENGDALMKLTSFWNKNQKTILVGLAFFAVGFGGAVAYKQLIEKPKEEKAADALFKAQQYFALDSSKLVLDGDGNAKGVLYVINNYSGTKAANLAHYYAGISYLKLGNFAKAVEHLKDFSTDAKQIQMVAFGALGDALSEQGKKEEAVDYYKKAGSIFEFDENSASEYLFRAALLTETLGKKDDALTIFKSIKDKFPKTDKGILAEKYIYRLSIEPNEFSVK
ncbi:MAG: tetratricopeptide repeat protein [Chitinophagaceae bacterium]